MYFVNWWGTTQFSSIQQLRLNASSNDVDVVYQEMDTDNNSTTSREKQDSLFYDSDDRQLYWSDSKRKAILRCSVKSLPCTDVVTVLNTDIHQSLGMLLYGVIDVETCDTCFLQCFPLMEISSIGTTQVKKSSIRQINTTDLIGQSLLVALLT